MNYIQAFMRDNDIQINEEFYIFDRDNRLGNSVETTFYFDEGLYLEEKVGDYHSYCSTHLRELMTGEYRIEKIPKKHKSVLDLKDGDEYYYIDTCGNVINTTYCITSLTDKKIIELGKAFLTKEEAKHEIERRKCESILLKYGTRNFMSLGDKYTKRYYIGYDYNANKIEYYFRYFLGLQGTIYFESEELAQKAADEVGEDRLKKYIFNVKE